MSIVFRAGTKEDAQVCGHICWNAFTMISRAHNFPPDFPSAEVATGLVSHLLSRPDIYSVVAEAEGKIVGSNFLWEGDRIGGIGPITIDPGFQNKGVGRGLMQNVIAHAEEKNSAGVRLVQSGFHMRSLTLYTKLGFQVREPLVNMNGKPLNRSIEGFPVRAAEQNDLEACNELCRAIHGHDRSNELRGAMEQKTATVVERNGRITGYATVVGFFGHAVAASNDDLKALIAAAPEIAGPGLLLPSRNTELFGWCLEQGLRVIQPLNLMSRGLYKEPSGPFLPSILF